jgi:hypothetical protein
MATTQTQTKTGAPTFDAGFEQVKETGEQFVAAARKAGSVYLDSYEKAVDKAIELELKFAGMTQQEWIKGLVETQADFTREVTNSYTSTARSLLK